MALSLSIIKNLQKLAVGMFKVSRGLSPEIVDECTAAICNKRRIL